MLGQACVVILSFADNIMIGWYGVNDLAASSFVNGLINLFIITDYDGIDPETPGAVYPIPRTYSMGVSVGF